MSSKKFLTLGPTYGIMSSSRTGNGSSCLAGFSLEVVMESYNNIIGIVGLVIIMVLFMFNGEILVNFMGYMLNALFAFADSLAVAG